jgi:hypothetical protein
LETIQHGAGGVCGGRAAGGIFCEELFDECVGFAGEMAFGGELCEATGGRGSGEHFVEEDTDGVEVGGWGGWFSEEGFRGEVVGCAEGGAVAGDGDGSVVRKGEGEVAEFDGVVRTGEDVSGFDVAVDDAVAVGVGEGAEETGGDVEGAGGGEWAGFEEVVEVAAFDEFGDDAEAAV